MSALRAFFLFHRRVAALLIAATLCMKALVPAGYMISGDGLGSGQGVAKAFTIQICGDADGHHLTRQITIPRHAKPGEDNTEHGKADNVCPYSAMVMASLSAADAPLLALALGFILALGFAPQRRVARAHTPYLQPPLRGPPAIV